MIITMNDGRPWEKSLDLFLALPRPLDGFATGTPTWWYDLARLRPNEISAPERGAARGRPLPAGEGDDGGCAVAGCIGDGGGDAQFGNDFRNGEPIDIAAPPDVVTSGVAFDPDNPGDYTGGSPNNDGGEHWSDPRVPIAAGADNFVLACNTPLPPLPWPGECASELAGSEASCGRPPCANCGPFETYEIDYALSSLDLTFSSSQYVPGWLLLEDLWGDLFGSALESSQTAVERDLLERAWTLLVQNWGIVEWAACMVEGEDLAQALGNKIDPAGRTDILVSDFHVCEFVAGFCTHWDPYFFDEAIHIARGEYWYRYLQADIESPRCSAISLSGTLLHELWHMVREWSFEGEAPCFGALLLENLYRWAVYDTCQGAASQPCCTEESLNVVDFFPSDDVNWPCPA